MNFIKDYLKGIFIGAGAILPGISSGVLCVIFGIYDKLVSSVLGIFKNFKQNFTFLFPIALGGVCGILIFGNILKYLFSSFPMQTKYAFIGLVLGSVPLLIKKVNSENTFKLRYLIFTIISFLIGLLTVVLEKNISSNVLENTIYIAEPFLLQTSLLLIISGFFMSIGVVVPGVSSTVILMCLGIYDVYLTGVANLDTTILIPMGIGLVIGGIIFLNIIKYLLDKYYMPTYYSIIGFTLGSIFVLYIPITFDLTGLISIILLITSFYIAGLFEKKAT